MAVFCDHEWTSWIGVGIGDGVDQYRRDCRICGQFQRRVFLPDQNVTLIDSGSTRSDDGSAAGSGNRHRWRRRDGA